MANYKQDAYYAPIVRAVENLLREKGSVAPVELFIRMDLLSPESAEDWRRGRISYLERVIRCNLSKASRILSILRMHAHDSDLKPSLTVYKRWTKGSRPLLRFSKTGDRNIEEAYARHFVSPRKKGCPSKEGAIEVGKSSPISGRRPWMKQVGKLKDLHKETQRINRVIEEAFEVVGSEMWASETSD